MHTVVVKVNSQNQIALPKIVCEMLGVKPGDCLSVVVEGRNVYLLPEPDNWSDTIYGLGEDVWADLGGGEQFLKDERASWEE